MMVHFKNFLPIIALASFLMPLAAQAKGAGETQHDRTQYVLMTSGSEQNPSRFSQGRAAERQNSQPSVAYATVMSKCEIANSNGMASSTDDVHG